MGLGSYCLLCTLLTCKRMEGFLPQILAMGRRMPPMPIMNPPPMHQVYRTWLVCNCYLLYILLHFSLCLLVVFYSPVTDSHSHGKGKKYRDLLPHLLFSFSCATQFTVKWSRRCRGGCHLVMVRLPHLDFTSVGGTPDHPMQI